MPSLASPRLLIVDDHTVIRLCARVILQHAWPDCVIEEAGSQQQARGLLARRSYDLMLLDFHLPDGLGIDLLREPAGIQPRIPAIAMSSDRTPDSLLACANAGLNTFLDKPLQAIELVQAVSRHLRPAPQWPSAAAAMMQASPEISHDVSARRGAPSAHFCHHLPPRRG